MFKNEFIAVGYITNVDNRREEPVINLFIKHEIDQYNVYLHIYCPQGEKISYRENEYVEIKGYVHGEEVSDKNGTRIIQHFRSLTIKKAESVMEKEFGIRGNLYYIPFIRYCISGELKKIKEDKDWLRIQIQTDSPEGKSIIKADWKHPRKELKLRAGDKICSVCTVQTPQKMIGDKKKHFDNILIEDLVVTQPFI